MILKDVEKKFDIACEEFIKMQPGLREHQVELVPFVKNHERKKVCLENICEQVVTYQESKRLIRQFKLRHKSNLDVSRGVNLLIAAAAQMFVLGVKQLRDESNWSEATRILRGQGDRTKRDVEHLLKEVPEDQTRGY